MCFWEPVRVVSYTIIPWNRRWAQCRQRESSRNHASAWNVLRFFLACVSYLLRFFVFVGQSITQWFAGPWHISPSASWTAKSLIDDKGLRQDLKKGEARRAAIPLECYLAITSKVQVVLVGRSVDLLTGSRHYFSSSVWQARGISSRSVRLYKIENTAGTQQRDFSSSNFSRHQLEWPSSDWHDVRLASLKLDQINVDLETETYVVAFVCKELDGKSIE